MKYFFPLAFHVVFPEPLRDLVCGPAQLGETRQLGVEWRQGVRRRLSVKHLLCMFLLALSLTGCGRSNQDYVPNATDARQALELALTNWKNGTKPGEAMQSPGNRAMVVELFDGDFSGGAQLKEWRIESEGSATSGPKQFQVVIQIANQGGAVPGAASTANVAANADSTGSPLEQKVTYYVTGMGGRFAVFRDKEYEIRSSQM